jgi:hypothetical protein
MNGIVLKLHRIVERAPEIKIGIKTLLALPDALAAAQKSKRNKYE